MEDEPPSRLSPLAQRTSALVVVTAVICDDDDTAIVAFAPSSGVSRALWDLADRDWGTVAFASPPRRVLELLEVWKRRGERVLLESFPDRHLVLLSDPDNQREPLILSAA